jgi:hypothetical protein
MKMKFTRLIALQLACLWAAFPARAELNFGVSLNSEGAGNFYLNVGNYYQVPQERVLFVRDRQIPDEEIPVVFFLASRAGVGPEIIIEKRLAGRSWMEIALFYRLDPGIFYVPLRGEPGPPYGRAYGYYKRQHKNQWNKIRLADADIVNFVNLRFLSEHYGYSPEQIVKFRGQGGRFDKVGKAGREDKGKGNSPGGQGKDKGRGKGKGRK